MPRQRAKQKDVPQTERGTEYVVLKLEDGSFHRLEGSWKGLRGDDAIKAATQTGDESHDPGVYRAVPVSTWDADSNNLEIVTEVRSVTSFIKPVKVVSTNGNGASRTPDAE